MTDSYVNLNRALEKLDSSKSTGRMIDDLDAAVGIVLKERDADLKRLAFLSKEPVVEAFVGIAKDVYDYACDCAEESGRDEPDDEDMLNGMRRLIDAAIAAANGGGDG